MYICFVQKADPLQEVFSFLFRLLFCHLAQSGWSKHDIFFDRHIWEEVELLEHHSDLFAHLIDVNGFIRNICSFKENCSSGWNLQKI